MVRALIEGTGSAYRSVIQWVRGTLRPGVTLVNLLFYLIAALLSVFFFVYVNAAQAYTLTNVVGVPATNLGDATGSLALYDELVSMVAVLLWGFASDLIGRRLVYTLGFLITGAATISIPFAFRLYPDFLLTRLTFAVGAAAAASMLTAVLADFVRDKNRGLLSGLVGLMAGVGAILAALVFVPLPLEFQENGFSALAATRLTYHIVAIISFTFAIALWFFIRPPAVQSAENEMESMNPDDANSQSVENEANRKIGEDSVHGEAGSRKSEDSAGLPSERSKSVVEIAKEGLLACKNPQVALGYVGGFVARADSIVLTLFITLYVNARFIKDGECKSLDINAPTDTIKELCAPAFRLGSILSGIAQSCALVGALLVGALSDRLPRSLTLALSMFLGLIGFALLSAIDTPKGGLAILAVCLMGLGQIGAVVVSLAMVTTSDVPADVRGSVAGVYGFLGSLGILLSGRVGGALFDSWREIAPFVLMAAIHGAAVLLATAVWLLESLRPNVNAEPSDVEVAIETRVDQVQLELASGVAER